MSKKGKKNKNFIMNPWTISIGSGLFILLVTIIIDIVTADKLFSTIALVFSTAWSAIIAFLNYELKVWWILIGILTLLLVLYLWVKYLEHRHPILTEPEFLQYTQDTILGFKWKWSWDKNYQGIYCISQLYPICSHCDTPQVEKQGGYGVRYICLRCNNGTNRPLPDFEHVKMMISDNVRRRYFPNA